MPVRATTTKINPKGTSINETFDDVKHLHEIYVLTFDEAIDLQEWLKGKMNNQLREASPNQVPLTF